MNIELTYEILNCFGKKLIEEVREEAIEYSENRLLKELEEIEFNDEELRKMKKISMEFIDCFLDAILWMFEQSENIILEYVHNDECINLVNISYYGLSSELCGGEGWIKKFTGKNKCKYTDISFIDFDNMVVGSDTDKDIDILINKLIDFVLDYSINISRKEIFKKKRKFIGNFKKEVFLIEEQQNKVLGIVKELGFICIYKFLNMIDNDENMNVKVIEGKKIINLKEKESRLSDLRNLKNIIIFLMDRTY